jgi:hypothetical protein
VLVQAPAEIFNRQIIIRPGIELSGQDGVESAALPWIDIKKRIVLGLL